MCSMVSRRDRWAVAALGAVSVRAARHTDGARHALPHALLTKAGTRAARRLACVCVCASVVVVVVVVVVGGCWWWRGAPIQLAQ